MDFFNEYENKMNDGFDDNNDYTEKEFFEILGDIIDEIKGKVVNDKPSDKHKENAGDIRVPIKDIIHNAMNKYGVSYGEYSVMILRQYFIALLNLGLIEIEELKHMVEKFVSQIDNIIYCEVTPSFYGGGVEIQDRSIYISSELSDGITDENYEQMCLMIDNGVFDEDPDETDFDNIDDFQNFEFEIEFYKAITAVITDSLNLDNKGITYIANEMIAEKVWAMAKKKTRIIMPKSYKETVGTTAITTRTGYLRCNIPISLFKQLCISYKINENVLFRDMLHSNFKAAIDKNCNGEMKVFLFVLNKYFGMYISRMLYNKLDKSELSLIDNFQLQLNKKFKKVNNDYYAFLALVTTDDLREKLITENNELFN